MLRLLFILVAITLGSWAQQASACSEASATPELVQTALYTMESAAADDLALPGRADRCECPAMEQDAQAIVSEFSKDLLVPDEGRASAALNSIHAASVALAEYSRASSFVSRRSEQPPYLLNPRLRQ